MAKNLPWFRAYKEMINDDKLNLLAFEDRWHYIALLCLKCDGLLDKDCAQDLKMRRIASQMGLSVLALDEVARRLSEVDLISKETLQPLAWGKRQFLSDIDHTAAERKAKQRIKEKELKNQQIKSDTDMSRVTGTNVTPLDTDTDTDKNKKLLSSSDDSCSPKKGKVALSKLECQQIADHYNDKLGDKLPRVALMSEKRMRLINARFQEMLNTIGANKEVRFKDKESGIAWFGRLFYKATMRGAFYFGDNDRGWTATFDWLLSPKAFTDLIESDPRKKE